MINSKKWGKNEYLKFISLYENHECLWNIAHINYKNREQRDRAYEDIRDRMDFLDVNFVKKKIKTIRDTYCIKVSKIKKSKKLATSPDDIYVPRLSWFSAIDKLLRKSGEPPKETYSSIDMEITKVSPSSSHENEIYIPEIEYAQPVAKKVRHSARSAPTNLKITIPKMKEQVSISSQMHSTENRSEESNQKNFVLYDEFYYFAMNIAEQLRQLPIENALTCQNKIQEIITKERICYERDQLECLSDSYYFPSPTS